MMEPMAVAVHAMRRFYIEKDSSVCVIGLGTIGLLLTMFLKAEGIQNVYVDFWEYRTKLEHFIRTETVHSARNKR